MPELKSKNRDLKIGLTYLHHTYEGLSKLLARAYASGNAERQPLPFKLYHGVDHYALCQELPLTLGDARWSFAAFRETQPYAPRCGMLTLETLSQLLFYSYGFSRHDMGAGVQWPLHRTVPSARCLFPSELYVWLPQCAHLPTGLYHYDNLHHRLALLRAGDYRDLLGRCLGADLTECLGVALISSRFWKTAFRYQNFAYRLCTQEVGIVASNVLMVAGTLGLRPHVHYQFLDQPLNQLIGCEPFEESTLVAVPLYAATPGGQRGVYRQADRSDVSELLAEILAIQHAYIQPGLYQPDDCSMLIEIDQASFLTNAAELEIAGIARRSACVLAEERVSAPPPSPTQCDLFRALHTRSSGDMTINFRATPIALAVCWEIIRYALQPYMNDLAGTDAPPGLQLYVAINHVLGLSPGVYRLCGDCNGLHIVERRDVCLALQAIQPDMSCGAANLVCYVVGDYPAASALAGNRSYRILHMESGLIAQRLAVMSAAQGLVARCSDSYNLRLCQTLLGLSAAELPLLQIAIGCEPAETAAGQRYRLSILF